MPTYEITAPDGQVYEVDAPDGATEADVMAYAQQHYAPQSAAAPEPPLNPIEGMSGVDLFRAGAGKGLTDPVRGVGNLIGAVSDAEIADAKQRDAPLMETGAGRAGNALGAFGSFLPFAFVPGANSIAGAGLVSALYGAATTPGGAKERATSGLLGAAGGSAGAAVGKGLAAGARGLLNSSASKGAAAAQQNAVKDATTQAARNAGYVLPLGQSNPTILNRVLEGISGKAATTQKASLLNQETTNNLARQAIGIPGKGPITAADIDAVKQPAMAVYGEVSKLSPDASQALAMWREASFDAGQYSKFYARTFDPAAQKAAQKASADAATWHQIMEQEAMKAGRPDLIPALQSARVTLGKIGTVDKAINESTGNVSARELGKRVSSGKPTTGELAEIGRMANAYPKAVQNVEGMGSVNVGSPLDWGGATLASLLSGNVAAMGLVGARPAIRAGLLSNAYQKAAAVPSYGPGLLSKGAVNAVENGLTQGAIRSVFPAYIARQE